MSETPEGVIRRYLDGHGGQADAAVEQLMTTWDLGEWGAVEQRTVTKALWSVDVFAEPNLGGTKPADKVVLQVCEERVSVR